MKFRIHLPGTANPPHYINLREFCIVYVERYSLTDAECVRIVQLSIGERFNNPDLIITRIA